MKLPIKFRGVDIDTGKYVFAELGDIASETREEYLTFLVNGLPVVRVDTIVQLCGYDADGREVYEDDTVYIDKDGYYREYVAHLQGYATNPNDGCYITLNGKFDARLKEESV